MTTVIGNHHIICALRGSSDIWHSLSYSFARKEHKIDIHLMETPGRKVHFSVPEYFKAHQSFSGWQQAPTQGLERGWEFTRGCNGIEVELRSTSR